MIFSDVDLSLISYRFIIVSGDIMLGNELVKF